MSGERPLDISRFDAGDVESLLKKLEQSVQTLEVEAARVKQVKINNALKNVEYKRTVQATKQELLNKAIDAKERLQQLKENKEVYEKLPKEQIDVLQGLIEKIPEIEGMIKQLEKEMDELLAVEGVEETRQSEAIGEHYKLLQQEKLKELEPDLAKMIESFEVWAEKKHTADEELKRKESIYNRKVDDIKTIANGARWHKEIGDLYLKDLLDKQLDQGKDKSGWGRQFLQRLRDIEATYGFIGHSHEKKVIAEILKKQSHFEDLDKYKEEYDKTKQNVQIVVTEFEPITRTYMEILAKADEMQQDIESQFKGKVQYGEEVTEETPKVDYEYPLPLNVKPLKAEVKQRLDLLMKRQLDVSRTELNGEFVSGQYDDFGKVKRMGNYKSIQLVEGYEQFIKETEGWELEKPKSEEKA